MNIITTKLPGVLLLEPDLYRDERGFFSEIYHYLKFETIGITQSFVQDNHSGSNQGVLRGMHYQLKHAQGKLVRVLVGEIYDVVIDMRKNAPTFGQWSGVRLSGTNKQLLWSPPGFAHGFYVLSDWAEVHYKATDYYAPEWERTIRWDDPQVGISWPLIEGQEPILSPKDANAPLLKDADVYDWEYQPLEQ